MSLFRADPHWTPSDAAVLAATDRRADREVVRLRLIVAIVITAMLLVIINVAFLWRSWVTFVAAANLVPALLALRLIRSHRYGAWAPWLLATSDVLFLFGIARFGPSFGDLLPGSRAALVSLWGSFLVMALMAIRPRAGTILYLTGLLALNFSAIVWLPATGSATPYSGPTDFNRLFSPGANIVRLTIIVLTGLVLALGAHRSRQALRMAIRSARERNALQRFVPQELDGYLAASDLQELQRGRLLEVGVLFADVRNYTALSEGLDAFRVAELLTSFRVRAERAVRRHGGIIDKFIGDGLLVVFGLAGTGMPADALLGALALAAEIKAWNSKRQDEGRRPIGIGIGAHVGECFVGALGGDQRMEFTVIGDAVNVAQRLEEATREAGAMVVVSGALLDRPRAGRPQEGEHWHELTNLALRGRHAPIRAFSLATTPPPLDP